MGKILSIIGWALTMEEAAKQFTTRNCNSEQTATSEEMTCQYTTTTSTEGDAGTAAGMKSFNGDDNNRSNI